MTKAYKQREYVAVSKNCTKLPMPRNNFLLYNEKFSLK